jgi:AcrR family transcriptional regulator
MSDSPPTSARRRLSGSQRRDRILDAAGACFARHGFSGTTTREVAARADITEAGLYRHFDSKEALYAAILDRKMQAPDLLEGLADAIERRDDAAVLGGLARGVLERGLGDPDFVRLLFFSALEGHELAESFFHARVRRIRESLAGYVGSRIEEGAFRDVDPWLAAGAFVGMVIDHLNGVVVFRRDDLAQRENDDVAALFTEIFLRGIRRGAAEAAR